MHAPTRIACLLAFGTLSAAVTGPASAQVLLHDHRIDTLVYNDGADQMLRNNPLYSGSTTEPANPLFEPKIDGSDDLDAGLAAPGSGNGLLPALLHITVGPVTNSYAKQGIIHRDLAARNLLLKTANGTFAGIGGFTLASDVPEGYSGPIRWAAPEVLRLRLLDPTTSNGSPAWFDLHGYSLTTTVVPEPVTLLGAASGLAWIGRRRHHTSTR
jgi:hypothetical protein